MITFFVPGNPAPQGSKRYLGRGVMVESSKRVKPWRADIRAAALEHFPTPFTGPVRVYMRFVIRRPMSHWGTGRNAKKRRRSAPSRHTQKPDLDKLVRAVGDALTGIAYLDDSQIVAGTNHKQWAGTHNERPGAEITVIPLDDKETKQVNRFDPNEPIDVETRRIELGQALDELDEQGGRA